MSLFVPPEADAAQRLSSDPAASVWVSANAGAGKTYVLTQRVVRLLLSGVAPRAVLCLTYTNAAAAEMAQRVYDALGALAVAPDARVVDEVRRLAPEADPERAAARARALFAEALETPGGLKIQTIHAFAAALLRRFPLEANVSGSFRVLDDATREELTDGAIATVLARAVDGSAEQRFLAQALPHLSDKGLSKAIKAMLGQRETLQSLIARGTSANRIGESLAALMPPEPPPQLAEDVCRVLKGRIEQSGRHADLAKRLSQALGCEADAREAAWRSVFLDGKGQPRKPNGMVPKAIAKEWPEIAELMRGEQDRLAEVIDCERAERAIEASRALLSLTFAVEAELSAQKRRRGLVDYDDQIETARRLVSAGTAAAWVRYKLDEGVDHVMVDEAQDTSPAQWGLVRALTDEFFAGRSAREAHRTLFVVGDEKQSIYSFQGAAPELFGTVRGETAEAAAAAGHRFETVRLAHSMRSRPQVLSAVDRVFADPALSSAFAEPDAVRHEPVKQGPGGVEVWPLTADEENETPDAWDAPFDRTADSQGVVRLVRAIADTLERWTAVEGPHGGPRLAFGDVLILSRRRDTFAGLMNRELKTRGIPTAGADRLKVTQHIAVKDMMALARCLISRDDLSLAAVLRGPLFGFSDDLLFEVAHARQGSLFAALREGPAAACGAADTLERWRRLAQTAGPFDMFGAILCGEGRRADFSARMGSEAEDALDAFLDEAAAFEAEGVPTLETFLERMTRTSTELRRSSEAHANAVRVMTAHGAKGLEAKVVFLVDIGETPGERQREEVVTVPTPEGGTLAYAPRTEMRPPAVRAALDQRADAARAEHWRLLYVGMTRAEHHLVVCGAYKKRAPTGDGWHAAVCRALGPDGERAPSPVGEAIMWRTPVCDSEPAADMAAPSRPEPERPPWLHRPVTVRALTPERLAPSSGEHAIAAGRRYPGPRSLDATRLGHVIHALLEPADGEDLGRRLDALQSGLPDDDRAAILQEVRGVLALPALAAPTVRCEVDVVGDVEIDARTRRAAGRIDRLQLDGAHALVVDYKTDRTVPATAADAPPAYLTQLAVYRALVAALLPGHAVGAAIVWTAAPLFMRVDEALPASWVRLTHR